MDPDERALVAAATAGDRRAFDELVRLYRVHVVSVARALLGGAAEAEDVAQEAFVRAWRSLESFRGDGSFRGWLHRIVVNCVITHHRRRSRWRRLFARGRHQADDSTLVPTAGNSQEAMVLRLAIDRALMQIPFQLRVALVLRDVQGLDYKEIAEVLRIPMGTVESRIFRGRQKMRALLAPLPGPGRPHSRPRSVRRID